jgi:hypothetical protein
MRLTDDMDATASLSTIAAAALGIAGFSGVMTAFMKKPGRLTEVETYRIAVLLGVSFGGMFLALVPMVLAHFGVGEPRLWGRASLLMVLYSVIALTAYLWSSYVISRQAPEIFNPYLFSAVALAHVVNIGLQLVNALRPEVGFASGIYVLGLTWYLAHAAIQFSRMVFVQPADR